LDETLAQQTFQTEIARNANIFEETKITKLWALGPEVIMLKVWLMKSTKGVLGLISRGTGRNDKAIEAGIPSTYQEAAARNKRIDGGQDVIVGG
jgi:hypothetical protein